MQNQRGFLRKRTFFRRRNFKKRNVQPSKTFKTMVLKVLRGNIEPKYITASTTAQTVDWLGGLNSFTDIVQGSAQTQRVGDELRLKSIDLRYQIACADTTQCMRIIVFQWFQNTVPTVNNILYSNGTAQAPFGALNFEQRRNYRILYDRMHSLDIITEIQNGVHVRIWKIPKRNIVFTTTGTTVGNNKCYIYFISDSSVAPHPTLTWQIRVNYTDG